MTNKLKEDAEFYRLALDAGLCPVEEAIAWCDAVIMEEAEPDQAIIDASLEGSNGAYAVARALRNVEGEFEEIVVLRRLFRHMRDLLVRERSYGYRIGMKLTTMASDYDYRSHFPHINWSETWDLYRYLEMPEEMAEEYRAGTTIIGEEEVAIMLRFLERESAHQPLD